MSVRLVVEKVRMADLQHGDLYTTESQSAWMWAHRRKDGVVHVYEGLKVGGDVRLRTCAPCRDEMADVEVFRIEVSR